MKFRLVDKIISWRPYESITGIKAVSFEEYSLKDPFGDERRLPETLLLESFLQLGNWLILLSSNFNEMGIVIRLFEVRFHDALKPGECVNMHINLGRRREDGFEMSGEGRVNNKVVISGLACLAVPVPTTEYANPEDLKVLFSEIYAPETPISVSA